MIGDHDPEDAYDAGDPGPVLLDVLDRVVDVLTVEPDDGRHRHRRVDALRLVANLDRRRDVDPDRLAGIRAALEAL